ncbi:MAG: endonuclease MutS2, partial [Chloroflexota bacterium]|nr:endonuclease MutS2 [Chloroflexota bacterium]
ESNPGISIGGARDVRSLVDLAEHAGVLDPGDLLDIKYTLIAARTLRRTLERFEEQYPILTDMVFQIPEPVGVIDKISSALSERGEILDTASARLGQIRHDLRIVHDRLLQRLERMLNDPKTAQYLQELLVTQRDGRYVLPLRAEFKGRIKAIIHDTSSSGATLFIEPLAVVELNNQYRELQLEERDEERRILAELSSLVAQNAFEIIHTVEIVATIDLAFSRAKYALKINATEPTLRSIEPRGSRHPGTILRLFNARHPLLDPETVVPIDVELDPQTYAMVITGPNTGGKTVTLKTVGLLALMAQSGMHIPAASSSEISIFYNIFADIGDEQSIEQSLSTFSGHITNIIRILNQANEKCLVILDELGAGTDPQEGAALARSLLNHLLERRIATLVTTHHPELKTYAHSTSGVVNASVEFDLKTLQPTYHLTIGLPGRSNALAIAQRLGLPEPIITEARSDISPEDLQVEDLLAEIHLQRELSHKARADAEDAYREAESLRLQLLERLDKIEDERRDILEGARLEAAQQVQDIQEEIAGVRKELARARQPLEVLEHIEEQVEEIEQITEQPAKREVPVVGIKRRRAIRLGDQVQLRRLGTRGVVSALSEEEAEVQVGMMRIRTRIVDLEPTEFSENDEIRDSKHTASSDKPTTELTDGRPPSPGIELDLRGQRADDALDALERYIEKAYLSGLPYARIIHGKGTGRLRSAVRDALQGYPFVKSFKPGTDKEGGDGVTVVKLDTNE